MYFPSFRPILTAQGKPAKSTISLKHSLPAPTAPARANDKLVPPAKKAGAVAADRSTPTVIKRKAAEPMSLFIKSTKPSVGNENTGPPAAKKESVKQRLMRQMVTPLAPP
jgi:hypothetical protein